MKLRFNNKADADTFKAIVTRHGYAATTNEEGRWIVISSAVDGKAKREIMNEWRAISTIDEGKPDKRQKTFKL